MIWIAEYITSMGIFWKFPSLVPSGLQIWLFCFVLQYNVCVSKFFNVDGCQHVLDEFGLFSTDGRRDIRILWNSNKIEAAHIQTKGKIVKGANRGTEKTRAGLNWIALERYSEDKWDINIHKKIFRIWIDIRYRQLLSFLPVCIFSRDKIQLYENKITKYRYCVSLRDMAYRICYSFLRFCMPLALLLCLQMFTPCY